MPDTRVVKTPDGRELCVEVAVADGPHAILVHPGTPNSRHLFSAWVHDARQRGATIAAYDRPGYGASTSRPGHTVADGARDAATVADALGFERFAVWGISGGGPYALACAALLGERVRAAALLGSVAPWGAEGLDYFAGMGQENVEDTHLLLSDPAASRRKTEEDRLQALQAAADPAHMAQSFATLVSPADARELASDFGVYLAWCTREGLAPGAEGWWDDGAAHLAPWGFDLAAVRVPVKVWHGAEDLFVPRSHGEWLARHIPGAVAALSDTDGHLTLAAHRIGEVHEWLLAHP